MRRDDQAAERAVLRHGPHRPSRMLLPSAHSTGLPLAPSPGSPVHPPAPDLGATVVRLPSGPGFPRYPRPPPPAPVERFRQPNRPAAWPALSNAGKACLRLHHGRNRGLEQTLRRHQGRQPAAPASGARVNRVCAAPGHALEKGKSCVPGQPGGSSSLHFPPSRGSDGTVECAHAFPLPGCALRGRLCGKIPPCRRQDKLFQ